jgi:cardiolipin synthase
MSSATLRIVTIDVLLKKGDLRDALGWIGAAWMSPILGSLLYYMFGINRVTRRSLSLLRLESQEMPVSGSGAQLHAPQNIVMLSKIGETVTARRLAAHNGISILQGGEAQLVWRRQNS